MVPEQLLIQYGAVLKKYNKDSTVLYKGQQANFFFQIKTGSVKMYNLSEDGKEFVLELFYNTQSFAEPPLFSDFNYPAEAITTIDSEIYVLPKASFLNLLKENFDVHLTLNKILCNRLKYKSMILSEISVQTPEHQMITLLTYLKDTANCNSEYEIPLTRQQLADLTGLRVETVIRTLKKLAQQEKIIIKNRKVFI
ncbi:Crp/Fnr family transcriptional regulator [Pseudofulvibacter geojedonensis]|uniref:Crp/Fnr family transcriptional regulator n=1 Tax=Pseudofulvibacter geojedonensis TaxID=1123758 RepID=A0ABW3I2D7_9FLAO